LRKNKIKTDVDLVTVREGFSNKLVGYSNADIEAVILMANDQAARENDGDAPVLATHFLQAASDYFPSRDTELLEYMELLAVFETSSRRLLPLKYASMTSEDLDMRLRQLRAIVGSRR
jgi:transitional endoplasmic reticulum ATPase